MFSLWASTSSSRRRDVSVFQIYPRVAFLRRLRVGYQLEHTIDIEDDHELSVEPVDAAGELGHAGVEVDGVFLAAGFGEPENLPDGVDQEPVGFAAQVDADSHRRLAVVDLRQAQ